MKTKLLLATFLTLSIFITPILKGQTIVKTSFYSQTLQKSNYVHIYLPPGYNSETADYPVIYYLHGWGGSQSSASLVMQLAETYINNGTIEPVIIVCANNSPSPFMGSFYVNSELNGNYEDYMTQELITWIEDNYRVKSGKNYRTLMGQSMGGYGSFRYGILHKDLYRGIAAHGSAINFDLAIDAIVSEIKAENAPGPSYFYDFNNGLFTQMIFAMAGAFAPNDNSGQTYIDPAIVEFPIDEQGNLIDTIYQKFIDNDPVSLISTLSPTDSVAILFGDGRNDNLHLFPSNFAFKDTLEYYGLDYEYFDHTGKHAMPAEFRERALIFLDSIMSQPVYQENYQAPSNLSAANITENSANLSWTENGTATIWDLMMGEKDFDTTNFTSFATGDNPFLAEGFTNNTSYDFYVRSNYGSGNVSAWAGPLTFTTLASVDTTCSQAVAHWPMNENGGLITVDISSNNNDGTLKNGTQWTNGVSSPALYFDGVNDKVDCGSSDLFSMGTGDFTISTWIKNGSTESILPTIAACGAGNTTDPGYWLVLKNDKLRLYVSNGTTRLKAYSNSLSISDNSWHHVSVVVDRQNDITFYLDGQSAGTYDISSFEGLNIQSSRTLTLGSWQSSSISYFNGSLDDFRLYDNALNCTEIASLANVPAPNNPPVFINVAEASPTTVIYPNTTELSVSSSDPEGDELTYSWTKISGPGEVSFSPNNTTASNNSTASFSSVGSYTVKVTVSDAQNMISSQVSVLVISDSGDPLPITYLPMDENSGTTAEDITPNVNDGTLMNGTKWTSGISGSALWFDGTDDRVECNSSDELNIGTNDFTISTWVKMGSQSSLFPTIVSKGAGNTTDAGYWLLVKNSRLRLYISDGNTRIKAESNLITVTDNVWYHLVVTIDRDGDISFYVDGVLKGTVDVSSFNGKDIKNTRNFTIGSWLNYSYTLIEGNIDDTKLYNVALDAYQVNNLFGEFAAFKTSPVDDAVSSINEMNIYPNPFNSSTSLDFSLDVDQHVNIVVYDLHGTQVTILKDDFMLKGRHSLRWNGEDKYSQILPPGMYIVKIIGDNNSDQKTIVKMR